MPRLVETFTSEDGAHRLEVIERDDGRFCFTEFAATETRDGEACWTPSAFSGLYDSPQAAVRDAKSTIGWLAPLP